MGGTRYDEMCASHRWEVPSRYNIAAGRLRQAPARQAGDDLGELRRRDARARLGRAPGPREPGGAHAGSPRGGQGATASPSCCPPPLRRPPCSSASGSSARSCSRCRCSTATTASGTASRDSGAGLLVTDAANAPRFDPSWAPGCARSRARPRSAPRRPTSSARDTTGDDPAQLYYTSGTTGPGEGHRPRTPLHPRPRGVPLLPRGAGRRAIPRDGRVGVGCRHRAAPRSLAARRRAMRVPARGRLRPAQAARLPQPPRGHERLHDPDRDALDDGDRGRREAVSAEVPPGVLGRRAPESRGDPLVPAAVRRHRARLLRPHGVVSARRQLSVLDVREGSMGKPMPGWDVQLLDEDEQPCRTGRARRDLPPRTIEPALSARLLEK